jgi:hypothetical protein
MRKLVRTAIFDITAISNER